MTVALLVVGCAALIKAGGHGATSYANGNIVSHGGHGGHDSGHSSYGGEDHHDSHVSKGKVS